MKESLAEKLAQQQLAFVGRLSAGFSHEFKNHLAVINESAGLIGDLHAAAKRKGTAVDYDRCLKIVESIGERVAIAAELTGHVNRFSHRSDGAAVDFSVSDVVAELLALMERFARQRKVGLHFTPVSDRLPVRNYPALLQFVCYSLLMIILGRLAEGGAVFVSVEQGNEGIRVTFQSSGVCQSVVNQNEAIADPVMREAFDRLSARVSSNCLASNAIEFDLEIPSLPFE